MAGRLRPTRPGSPPSYDQVSLRSVLYASPARLAVLTPEYNCRFEMAGCLSTPVKVLHGRAAATAYPRIAEELSRDLTDDPAGFGCRVVHIAGDVHRLGPGGAEDGTLPLGGDPPG